MGDAGERQGQSGPGPPRAQHNTYQDDQVACLDADPQPAVLGVADVKVAGPVKDAPDLLVLMEVPFAAGGGGNTGSGRGWAGRARRGVGDALLEKDLDLFLVVGQTVGRHRQLCDAG